MFACIISFFTWNLQSLCALQTIPAFARQRYIDLSSLATLCQLAFFWYYFTMALCQNRLQEERYVIRYPHGAQDVLMALTDTDHQETMAT